MKWVLLKKEIKENFYAINGTIWLLLFAILMSLMAYSFTIDTEWNFLTGTDIMVAVTMLVLGNAILMTILIASVSISNEKENGTLESLLLTPTTKTSIAFSKIGGSVFKWLLLFIISVPYIYSLGVSSSETLPMIVFIFVAGTVLIITYAALAVGISLLCSSSKNALVLSIGVFLATLMPMFLPDAFRATGLGQLLENISPLANMVNLMAKVVFMEQSLLDQMPHIVPMVIYTAVTFLFLRHMTARTLSTLALFIIVTVFSITMQTPSYAQDINHDIMVEVTSDTSIDAIMGQEDVINVAITNKSAVQLENLKAYIVLLDKNKEMNMDLEEFNADMFYDVPVLETNEKTNLAMNIKYFLVGEYYLYVSVLDLQSGTIVVSNTIDITVTSESGMDNALVRAVAIGEPIVIGMIALSLMWLRKRKIRIG